MSWYPTTDYQNEQNPQDFDNQYDLYAPALAGQSRQPVQWNQWPREDRAINIGGRQCRIVCDRSPPRPRPRPGPRPPSPGYPDRDRIRQLILNRTINEARRYYANIRVVRENGRDLIVTQDYRADRANVEVYNGVITRFYGFY